MSRAAAVVVAWNGGEALERCVASLRGQGIFEILIVDNGSRSSERQRLEKLYGDLPDIRLLLQTENRGFAAGANAGFEEALRDGAESVLLVTQDVVLQPEALLQLQSAMRSYDAAIAGPLVLDERNGEEISRGERLVLEWICLPRRWLRYRGGGVQPYEVSGVMGCVMLLRRDCLESTRGFDPSFFAYYEEVDLCLRARQAGFRIACAPAARVTHDGMRGFLGGFTPLAAELKARNLIWLMRKHGSPLRWLTFAPTYVGLLLSSAVLYLARGRADVLAAMLRGAIAGCGPRSHATTHLDGGEGRPAA